MKRIPVADYSLDIHPIPQEDLDSVLKVYQQCEDFLALGPVPSASIDMVLKDIAISQAEGGLFCGIYSADGDMIGILDYVPSHYRGDPAQAFLELLMLAAPFRKQGLGKAIVEALENEIRKDTDVMTILSGVQVNNPRAVSFWQRNGYRIVSGPEMMPDGTTVFRLRKDFDGAST